MPSLTFTWVRLWPRILPNVLWFTPKDAKKRRIKRYDD